MSQCYEFGDYAENWNRQSLNVELQWAMGFGWLSKEIDKIKIKFFFIGKVKWFYELGQIVIFNTKNLN